MKRVKKLLSLIVLLFYGVSLYAQNTDIRGQVVNYNVYYKNYTPVSNIKVALFQTKTTKAIKTTYTDADGMYYIYNTIPGQYILRINSKKYNININKQDQQFQDMSRILLSK